jgi:hypothetical protein
MSTTTIIVNGFARAGKDSFVDACAIHAQNCTGWLRTFAFSSIDPVKELLTHSGIDMSGKTDPDRKLWADVGASLEEHSGWRSKKCVTYASDCVGWAESNRRGCIVFLHIREPAIIAKVIAGIAAEQIGPVHTLLIRGPREIMPNNVADNSVLGMTYDDTIQNDGDLRLLSDRAYAYLKSKGLM